jgi:hypothetical protein
LDSETAHLEHLVGNLMLLRREVLNGQLLEPLRLDGGEDQRRHHHHTDCAQHFGL